MSLNIDIGNVHSVLIAGVWYDVDNKSFNLDSFEFLDDGETIHGGGKDGICATGFTFKSNNVSIQGPLSAVQAVSNKPMVGRRVPPGLGKKRAG